MKRRISIAVGVGVAIILVILAWWLVRQGHFDVLAPSGTIAVQERNLLVFTLCLSALVVIPVYGMLGAFAWRYREDNKKAKYTPGFTKSTVLESVWWGIPILIIGILSVMTWQTSHALDPYKKLASDQKTINVEVVALQWKWLFIYPDYGIATVNQLTVPEKAPIHFSLTANAPMSGFWVPALGTQIYAMNGMSSQLNLKADTTGDFHGYSTNINGQGYADMVFTVHSLAKDGFDRWAATAKKSPDLLTMDAYETLARASVIKHEMTYRLGDKNLYQTILAKGMSGMSQGGQRQSNQQTDKTPEQEKHDETTAAPMKVDNGMDMHMDHGAIQ